MISPLLFNIYVEDIIIELHEKMKIPIQDILFYADDLAIICSSEQTERIIRIIEDKSKSLSLIINKKISGILDIKLSRRRYNDQIKEILGIPIVRFYNT